MCFSRSATEDESELHMIEFIQKKLQQKSLIIIFKMKKRTDVPDSVLNVQSFKRKSLKSLPIGSPGVQRATGWGVCVC